MYCEGLSRRVESGFAAVCCVGVLMHFTPDKPLLNYHTRSLSRHSESEMTAFCMAIYNSGLTGIACCDVEFYIVEGCCGWVALLSSPFSVPPRGC